VEALTVLHAAEHAGLQVETDGSDLYVTGPRIERLAALLDAHKAAVVLALDWRGRCTRCGIDCRGCLVSPYWSDEVRYCRGCAAEVAHRFEQTDAWPRVPFCAWDEAKISETG
jgi:hypothetical protein